jgi:hypothetical protein
MGALERAHPIQQAVTVDSNRRATEPTCRAQTCALSSAKIPFLQNNHCQTQTISVPLEVNKVNLQDARGSAAGGGGQTVMHVWVGQKHLL